VSSDVPSMLITDDDRDFRETLGAVFEPRGFRTLLAPDGEAALRIARSEQVHVVLCDMHMPRMDGLEVVRELKSFDSVLPCILISADFDPQLIDAARQADVFSHLSKPVSFREVTDHVQRALQVTYGWPNSFFAGH